MQFEFPSGSAVVNLIPETAKLNVNQAPPLQLMNLMMALGRRPEQAQAITQGIVDWRTPSPGGSFTAVRPVLSDPHAVFSGPARVFS